MEPLYKRTANFKLYVSTSDRTVNIEATVSMVLLSVVKRFNEPALNAVSCSHFLNYILWERIDIGKFLPSCEAMMFNR